MKAPQAPWRAVTCRVHTTYGGRPPCAGPGVHSVNTAQYNGKRAGFSPARSHLTVATPTPVASSTAASGPTAMTGLGWG